MNALGMIYFGFIWLGVTAVTSYQLLAGNELRSIHIPRVLSFVYDGLGIEWGTAIQGVLSLLVILWGFKMLAENRKAKREAMEAREQGLGENGVKLAKGE